MAIFILEDGCAGFFFVSHLPFCFSSEILKKRTLNYTALHFPSSPVGDEEEFPPPPPDALGLPPKMKSHGSLEEIEVL